MTRTRCIRIDDDTWSYLCESASANGVCASRMVRWVLTHWVAESRAIDQETERLASEARCQRCYLLQADCSERGCHPIMVDGIVDDT